MHYAVKSGAELEGASVMSGEIILVPALGTPLGATLLAGAGAVVLAGAALRMVEAWRDEKRRESQRLQAEEKRATQAWQTYQSQQQQISQVLMSERVQLQEQLQNLALLSREASESQCSPTDSITAQAEGFIQRADEARSEHFAILKSWIEALPDALFDDKDLPFQRLRKQWLQYCSRINSGELIDDLTLVTFKDTLQATLEAHERALVQRQEQLEGRLGRCERCLEQVLEYEYLVQQLAPESIQGYGKTLDTLKQKLLQALKQGEVSVGLLDLVQRQFDQIATQIDDLLQSRAVQTATLNRLQHHMEAQGYQLLQDEIATQSVWSIPGGERVIVQLHPDHRIATQVVHERAVYSKLALSADELAFLRQQEDRWCKDVQQVLKNMIKDGFQYAVQFERDVPEENISVVVVESVDELLAADELEQKSDPRALK
ncbi:hypothetical protein OLMES_4379 [Oleiphilus messinensis]|uniref:Uncharacterized protein n=2 Tax=Oleiphilus messinensis TaxID=141451 RepID=A0A1Y0IF04_9GAMM|nr:hypothetical protein OLMES_4379 [Oleiphilus messinensis]